MRSLYWKHILSQRKHKFKLKCPNFWLKRNQDTKNMLNNKQVTAWTHTNAPWYTGMKMSRLHTRNFSNYSTSCIWERDKMAAVADFTQDESLVGAEAKLSPPPNKTFVCYTSKNQVSHWLKACMQVSSPFPPWCEKIFTALHLTVGRKVKPTLHTTTSIRTEEGKHFAVMGRKVL